MNSQYPHLTSECPHSCIAWVGSGVELTLVHTPPYLYSPLEEPISRDVLGLRKLLSLMVWATLTWDTPNVICVYACQLNVCGLRQVLKPLDDMWLTQSTMGCKPTVHMEIITCIWCMHLKTRLYFGGFCSRHNNPMCYNLAKIHLLN